MCVFEILLCVGRGDWCQGKWHEGCFDLLNTIQGRVRPKFHICGHIHEGKQKFDGLGEDTLVFSITQWHFVMGQEVCMF